VRFLARGRKRVTLEPVRKIPAILAFVLLGFQAALPWTAAHFVTEDGPSHVYASVVARELLFHPQSPYHAVYALQHVPIPNWTSTVLLALFASIVGSRHAEQLLVTFLMILGFYAFSFAAKSFPGAPKRWTPLANALLMTFFLTRGYYNFELGMMLGLLILGYAVRHLEEVTPARASILCLGWVILFFTHLLPAVLSLMAFFAMAACVLPRKRDWASLGLLVVSTMPTIALTIWYAKDLRGAGAPSHVLAALSGFPSYLFWVSSGYAGHQAYLFPGLLVLLIARLAYMTRGDWATARGGLAIAAVTTFFAYLFVPDAGFGGGGEIKVRVAWAAILFAGVLAASVAIPRWMWIGFSLFFAAAALGSILTVKTVNARASIFVEGYERALRQIPAGSRTVRLYYPAPFHSQEFGIPADLLFLPLLHIDSGVAAERGGIEMSNYEAAARIFPIVFQPQFSPADQWLLWTLDNSEKDGSQRLKRLQTTLPRAIDYYVVFGETTVPDVSTVMQDLESAGKKVASSAGDPPFVRVYH
jgi:hypothetical protein